MNKVINPSYTIPFGYFQGFRMVLKIWLRQLYGPSSMGYQIENFLNPFRNFIKLGHELHKLWRSQL